MPRYSHAEEEAQDRERQRFERGRREHHRDLAPALLPHADGRPGARISHIATTHASAVGSATRSALRHVSTHAAGKAADVSGRGQHREARARRVHRDQRPGPRAELRQVDAVRHPDEQRTEQARRSSVERDDEAIMTRKPALTPVPSANSTARCSLQIISALKRSRSHRGRAFAQRARAKPRQPRRCDKRRTGVESGTLSCLSHVFFLGTEIARGREAARPRAEKTASEGAKPAPPQAAAPPDHSWLRPNEPSSSSQGTPPSDAPPSPPLWVTGLSAPLRAFDLQL